MATPAVDTGIVSQGKAGTQRNAGCDIRRIASRCAPGSKVSEAGELGEQGRQGSTGEAVRWTPVADWAASWPGRDEADADPGSGLA